MGNLFFGSRSIKSHVLKVVHKRIAEAQRAYDKGFKELVAMHEQHLKNLESKHERDKDVLFTTHVEGVLKKILE